MRFATVSSAVGAQFINRLERNLRSSPVESKTRTYHGWVNIPPEASVPAKRPRQGIEKTSLQKPSVPAKAARKRCVNILPEARTSGFFKPNEKQNCLNQRLTSCLSAVYHRKEMCALFLAADK